MSYLQETLVSYIWNLYLSLLVEIVWGYILSEEHKIYVPYEGHKT